MHNDAYYKQKCESQRQAYQQSASEEDDQSPFPFALFPRQPADQQHSSNLDEDNNFASESFEENCDQLMDDINEDAEEESN
jgi:hypothetical protein